MTSTDFSEMGSCSDNHIDGYLKILMELPDIVYRIDPDGYFRFLNESISVLGYKPEELIGKHFSTIVHPDDVKSFSRIYVLPKYRGRVTGPAGAPKLFDERRTGARKTRDLIIRLLPKKSSLEPRIGKVIALGEVNSVGHYGDRKDKREFLGTLGIIRDITDQVRLHQQLHYQADMIRFVSDAIISTDLDFRVRTWNRAAEKIYGWHAYEVMDRPLFKIIGLSGPIFSNKRFLKKLKQDGSWQGETVQRRKDRSLIYMFSSFSLIKDNLDRPTGVVMVNHDITALKKAEQIRQESELQFQKFFKNAPEYCYIVSLEGKISDVNRAALKALGYKKKEIVGRFLKNFYSPEFRNIFESALKKKNPRLRNKRVEVITKSGAARTVLLNIDSIKDRAGKSIHLIVTQYDITGLNLLRDKLYQSQEVMAKTFMSLDDAVFILDSSIPPIILDCNPAAVRIFGYTKRQIVGRSVEILHIDKTALKKFQAVLYPAVKKQGFLSSFEFQMRRKGGEIFPSVHSVYPLKDNRNKMVGWISVVKDITQYKHIENTLRESEEKYRSLVENINDVLYSVDVNGIITYMSPVLKEITGYEPEEVIGQNFMKYVGPQDRPRILKGFKEVLAGKPGSTEYRIMTRSGGYRWVRLSSQPVYKDKKLIGLQGILTDITEERETKEALTASLKEKEVLLREIHHRVKNNMQIMSSLLSLQTRFLKDPELSRKFIEAQNRIRAMAFIHESLYKSQNPAQVDFYMYVTNLVKNLFKTYGVKQELIKFVIKIKDIFFDIDTAIPCGLIINELVSNALKYSFPSNKKGMIRVVMSREKGMFSLIVEDNGIGFPDGFDIQKVETLGLQLVRILVEQLNGTLNLHQRKHTRFLIKFKAS